MKSVLNRTTFAALGALAVSALVPSVNALSLTVNTPNITDLSVVNNVLNDQESHANYVQATFGMTGVHPDAALFSGSVLGNNQTENVLDLTISGKALSAFGQAGGPITARLEDTITLDAGTTKFWSGPALDNAVAKAWLEKGDDEWLLFDLNASGNYEFLVNGLAAGSYTLVLEATLNVQVNEVNPYVNFEINRASVPDGGGTLVLLALGSLGLFASFRKSS